MKAKNAELQANQKQQERQSLTANLKHLGESKEEQKHGALKE